MEATDRWLMSPFVMAAHVFTLCALAIGKPLYDILANHPEYFVVNRILSGDIYLFVFAVAVLAPLCLTILVMLSGLIGKRTRLVVQSVVVAGLTSLLVLPIVKHLAFLPASISVVLSVGIATGIGIYYFRSRQFTGALTWVSPLILLFPLLFVFHPNTQRILHPDRALTQADVESGAVWLDKIPPIVMIIFDEFSLVDLLDARGNVDSKRFPNFGRLAADSTWYANATTTRHATTWAIPVILTGKWAKSRALPRFEDYPENFFSLLQAHYTFNVIEPVTDLRPPKSGDSAEEPGAERAARLRVFAEDMAVVFLHISLPEAYAKALPSINVQWGGFIARDNLDSGNEESQELRTTLSLDNDERTKLKKKHETRFRTFLKSDRKSMFESFISSLEDFPKSTLHFIHMTLPHRPSQYLPSGKIYTATRGEVRGVQTDRKTKAWIGDKRLVDRLHQGHLIQLGFTDGLIGELIAKMKECGLYEDSLIVLTADHGVSFQPGVSNRRPYPENYGELAFIPLFIKYPNQNEGSVDHTNVQILDILPTIVDVLGAKVSWKFDGRSLIDPEAPIRDKKTLPTTYGEVLEYSEQEYLAAKEAAIARNAVAFSLEDPRADLFHFEPGLELVGKNVSELEANRTPCSVECPALQLLRDVDLDAPYIPTHMNGRVSCSGSNPTGLLLAVSVNGVVQVVTQTYEYEGDALFDVVVSDTVFRQGANDVEILLVPRPSQSEKNPLLRGEAKGARGDSSHLNSPR